MTDEERRERERKNVCVCVSISFVQGSDVDVNKIDGQRRERLTWNLERFDHVALSIETNAN